MTLRRPLVIVTGRVQELPTGDTLPGGGAASDYPLVKNLIAAADTAVVTAGYTLIAASGFTIDGILQLDGDLILVG